MISLVYTISSLISLAVLVYIISGRRYQNTYFLLMQLVTFLSNLGYVAFSRSTVIEEALLATKIYYVGGCFLNLFCLFICCDVCQIKLNRWIKLALSGLSIFTYFLVWTIGYSPIYYKSATLYYYEGIVRLQKEYGPMHSVYNVLLYGLTVINIGILIYAFINKKEVSRNSVITLGLVQLGSMVVYVAQRAVGIPMDLMPVVYIVVVIICAMLIDRQAFFDVTVNKMRQMAEEGVAYVFFDRKMRLMAYDERAVEIFPSLRENNTGERISVMNGDFEHQMMAWITTTARDKTFDEVWKKIHRGNDYTLDVKPLSDEAGYYVSMQVKKASAEADS